MHSRAYFWPNVGAQVRSWYIYLTVADANLIEINTEISENKCMCANTVVVLTS